MITKTLQTAPILLSTAMVAFSASPTFAQSDHICDAIPVFEGTSNFSTVGFTEGLISECNDDASDPTSEDGWFVWTPTIPGRYQVSLCETDFSAVLRVLTGTCTNVLGIACDRDDYPGDGACYGGTVPSPVGVFVTIDCSEVGTDFLIQIDGKQNTSPQSGTGVISIRRTDPTPSSNNLCSTAEAISDTGSWAFDNAGTFNCEEPEASCQAGGGGDLEAKDVWYEWTAPASDSYRFSICNAEFDVVLTAYDSCGGSELACSESGYTFGTCTGGVNDVGFELPALAGDKYLLRIDGWNAATGTGVLTVSTESGTPVNDECVNALPFSGVGSIPFSNENATASQAQAACVAPPGSADIWYRWTPEASVPHQLEICGAGYDAVLAVYDACGGNELACSESGYVSANCAGTFFDVGFILDPVVAGTPYLIRVDGFEADTGTGVLNITEVVPDNDECSGATVISGEGSTPFDTTLATGSSAPADCVPVAGSSDIWFSWTPDVSTPHELKICGASYDVVLAAYDSCGSTATLACSESEYATPPCGGTIYDVGFILDPVVAGTSYLLRIDGWGGVTGTGVLDITALDSLGEPYCTSAPNSVDPDGAAISLAGSASVGAQDLTLSAGPVPDQPGIFYFGPNQIQAAFGNGFRCVGGSVYRLPVTFASSNVLSDTVDFTTTPGSLLAAGQTWNFQAWYRDPNAGGDGFNLSNGITLTFVP